jgi:hypothetical protein
MNDGAKAGEFYTPKNVVNHQKGQSRPRADVAASGVSERARSKRRPVPLLSRV